MNRYQKIIIAIVVAMAVVISGTIVFAAFSCSKTDKSQETTQTKEFVTTIETKTLVEVVLYTNDENVNLREKASKDTKSLAVLPRFTKLVSDGTKGDWTHVKYENKVGYVKTEFLMSEADYKKAEEESKKAAKKAKRQQVKLKRTNGSGRVICIDPGHQTHGNSSLEPIGPGASKKKAKVTGGTSGTVSGLTEYQLNLQVSLKLKKALRSQGYKVVMTRETNNVNISNSERAAVANNAGADAFIRIHANGGGSGQSGILTMCPTANNPYCSEIYSKSRKLADCILDEMISATGANRVGVSEVDNMSGINWSKVPVTIVEMGFMTNAVEDRKMATDSYQNKLVTGIVNGLADYFN